MIETPQETLWAEAGLQDPSGSHGVVEARITRDVSEVDGWFVEAMVDGSRVVVSFGTGIDQATLWMLLRDAAAAVAYDPDCNAAADGAYDDHQETLRAEDQAQALRVAAACEIVMAEGADVWAFAGFANPDGQDGISDSRIAFTGIDDDSQLHFAINATRVGQQVEVTTSAPPEQCPIPWCERATANKALVDMIVDVSNRAAARDAHMRATGEAPRT